MEFTELEVPVEKYPGITTPTRVGTHSSSSNSNLNVRRLGRGDSRENWDPIKSAREREFREKPPPMLKIAVVGDSAVGKTTICEAFASETGFTFSKKYHMTCGVQVYAKSIRLPKDEKIGESNRRVEEPSSLFPGARPTSNNDIPNERVNLILLDSSSKDIYFDLLPKYWEKLDGFVLVMDVSNSATLDNCKMWLELVKGCLDPKAEMLGILLGNKTDVGEDRAVATKKAQEFASDNNLHYFEVTAKQNSGLEPAFMYLAQEWASRKVPYK
jgi:GTPase SAR1 family protein